MLPKAPLVYSNNESLIIPRESLNSSLDEPYTYDVLSYPNPEQQYCRLPAHPNIYFSWANVMPNQQVLLRLSKSKFSFEEYYFPNETVSMECQIPMYGFSYEPFLQIAINGSVILEGMQNLKLTHTNEKSIHDVINL